MAPADLTAKDRERFAGARARGRDRAHDASSVVDARYEPATDAIRLVFRGGGSMMIPRRVIPGLARQARSTLEAVSISAAGDALSWPALDIDVFVPGLVERVFGTRLFAAATGRRGGRRRTKAKVVAAKLNGVKGGRPRKRESA